ncbi:uncharacterized protein LOC108163666 [Drosophila miranda]|uniref:uncharacterized protein LOC108163666 n=1 Tax=Drosophila miranda TaxID=7229 RepID=UPI0007E86FEC|nr:uncharacterized protein LOC108163666 [Drosophila miranda]
MNFKCCCLLFLSLLGLMAGAMARPERHSSNTTPHTTPLPSCTPWCAGQPPPPPGAVN